MACKTDTVHCEENYTGDDTANKNIIEDGEYVAYEEVEKLGEKKEENLGNSSISLGENTYVEDNGSTSVKKQMNWKLKYFVIISVILVMVAIIIGIFVGIESSDDINLSGVLDNNVSHLFAKFDIDKDGYLSPHEFQIAFYDMKDGSAIELGNILQSEKENFQLNVSTLLENQLFTEDEEILHLKTTFKPMDITTMKNHHEGSLLSQPNSVFHLNGLTSWVLPNIDSARFSVANFSVLMPEKNTKLGSTWQLVKTVMAGDYTEAKHLPGFRYLPPHPANPTERLLIFLMSMIHKRPFLHMRFPPRGTLACLQAYNDDYYSIMFRMHFEFQLNLPPRYPFWFTPASMIGELIIKKDGSHIEFFKMYLPSHIKLNIDMEWITGKADPIKGDSPGSQYSGEVDIGFCEEMKIESLHPSRSQKNFSDPELGVDSIAWTNEISKKEVLMIIEKEFYPFKEVPYLPFNKSFEAAKKESKLIHHVLLWGSLDDQSC